MTRTALALALCAAGSAHAGDSVAADAAEMLLAPYVIEVEDFGRLLLLSDRFDDAALRAFVFDGPQITTTTTPVPVPAPPAGLLLAVALFALTIPFSRRTSSPGGRISHAPAEKAQCPAPTCTAGAAA